MPDANTPADGDTIPLHDWEGRAITAATCAACDQADLHAAGACERGRCCMQDAYARRIDRFFRTHPQRAAAQLAHPYFEVRAIAARHTDVFRLPPLLDDPDETVRMQLALRLPLRWVSRLRLDPHREVRIRVAQRLPEAELPAMVRDADHEVRKTVARRLPPALLPLLAADPDREVRREVARRLEMPALLRLADDEAPEVRRIVAERLPAALLATLAADDDWLVRWQVAARAPLPLLARLADDPEAEVRERAAERRAELGEGAPLAAASPSDQPA